MKGKAGVSETRGIGEGPAETGIKEIYTDTYKGLRRRCTFPVN
jgi:hypothetical protein